MLTSHESGPSSPPSGIDLSHYSAWRERHPYQHWLTEPTIVSKESGLAANLRPTMDFIRTETSRGFVASGGQPAELVVPSDAIITPEQLVYSVFYKFSVWGKLHAKIEAAFGESDLDKFNQIVRKNIPPAGIEAIKVAQIFRAPNRKRLIKAREMPRHLVLQALIQDNSGAIENATHDQKIGLARCLMVNNGVSNLNAGLYTRSKSGKIEFKGLIRNTLESGHPYFPTDMLDELGYREWVSASMRPNKIDVKLADIPEITYSNWMSSGAVNGIRRSGTLFGKYGYLSDSVVVKELTSSWSQGERIKQASEFTQQGEGAFWSQEILLDYFLSSATGQMGAVKANLQPNEIVPLTMIDKDTVGSVRIEGLEPNKPSVEGAEFYEAMRKMLEEHPIRVRLNKDGTGFVLDDNGPIVMAPTWAGGHLHREAAIPEDAKRVAHLHVDPKEYPTFGCGVDGSFEFTQHYFREATKLWEESGRTLKLVTINRAGHGTDYIQFPVVDEVNPLDHSIPLEQVLDSGELVMEHDVKQIEERIAPWAQAA
ncbi:hypothetical protein HYW35_00910 [Candidatus Saccharibacteria bacterium]|nr:hypothetical protein [Candidatus Saccharibacteria bacterium]